MFEGEEGFKLVLYIEDFFDTGEKLAKEDCCLNSFETRRGLFSCMCDTFIELSLFPRSSSGPSTEKYKDFFLGLSTPVDYVMYNHYQNHTYLAI